MNPYEVLEISEEATEVEIRKAYKKQALRYHPDKVIDPAEKEANEIKFKEITHAYEILTNKDSNNGFFGGDEYDNEDDADFRNFFTQDFNGGPPPPPPQTKNPDVIIEIELTTTELYNGKNIKFQLSRAMVCGTCEGNGWRRRKNGNLYEPPLIDCSKCHGKGFTERTMRTPFGFSTVQRLACTKCASIGKVRARPNSEKNRCKKCHGEGLVQVSETVTVSVPRGYTANDRITLHKQADQTLDGKDPGDIVFVIKEKATSTTGNMKRHDKDLFMSTTVTLMEAIGGFQDKYLMKTYDSRTLTWSTPSGKVLRPGDIIKVSGEGWPISTDKTSHSVTFGDLYVTINIEFPPDNWVNEKNDLLQLRNILPGVKKSKEDTMPIDAKNCEHINSFEIVHELPKDEPNTSDNDNRQEGEANPHPHPHPQGVPECSTQ
ncbi:similar to Saccharomyces cerevisiae YLR090W XDJ1 Putative chaperone, homolog of E. coli DnaJ, closely related to Ydj1p [Maudiozyma barnettii]|uniref:Similar to Saccharomyces cerevisiae YLR090W XDJ1 Putative chaperone, homolog of E. coli DnaJ, closely related to Ydj1p n=1 Tax=Maudiozyma barnettii TaxID=61262 RepID=A0A8H2ZIZ6_9SACH|nr:Xdj1p [Kazachstania barnettii]CAB4255483.1 similar to Saccharomyces cerevisiae YLR090W XDJ1 Putative chaperone, homolog of E. coli DnaJ, closely related to Ydj1p [Kazachstania barnettii]CAD1783969.1 similar to Saccharomyces cerevisiae YLR090W XDJ1 Putative chaperone, homolog of E. coli DnaJ, closely related to Ydj1p [Kazachstania barnettii]